MKPQWLIFLFVLIASNVATGYVVKKNAPPKVDPQRDMRTALAKMTDAKGPFAVIIGDSITQGAKLPESICDTTLINAGVNGSRASSFVPFAEEMTSRGLAPAAIIVALGVNDASINYRTKFAASYSLLLDSLPGGSPVALATIAPVDLRIDEGKHSSQGSIEAINLAIRNAAAQRNLQLIDLEQLQGLATEDGVHPLAASYLVWNAAMLAGVKTALDCDRATAAK